MSIDSMEKSTCFHTICRLILKELRQEKYVQQAHISQLLSRSPSSWSKVETGETPLSLDHLLTACSACQVWPSQLFITAQNYMSLLNQNNWYVAAHGTPLDKESDLLSRYADEYYDLNLEQIRTSQVLLTPWPSPGIFAPLDVFKWAIDQGFRQSNRKKPVPIPPPLPL